MSSYSPYYAKSPANRAGGSGGAAVNTATAIATAGFVASAATIYQNTKSIGDLKGEIEDLKKKIIDIGHIASSAESSAARSANSFRSLSQSFGNALASSSTPIEDFASYKKLVVENAKKINAKIDHMEGRVERLEISFQEMFERIESLEESTKKLKIED